MRPKHASLLVGAAVLGLGAFALPAAGKNPATHEMTIQLPGGGSETIRYTGDVPPNVTFAADPLGLSGTGEPFALDPSFATIRRIAAEMDRQMDAFWRQPRMGNWTAGGEFGQRALPNLVPGSSSYSVVSESFGNNVCTRMTEITAAPNGRKPKVLSRTSGNCDASPAGASTALTSGARTIADHDAIPATAVPRTAL